MLCANVAILMCSRSWGDHNQDRETNAAATRLLERLKKNASAFYSWDDKNGIYIYMIGIFIWNEFWDDDHIHGMIIYWDDRMYPLAIKPGKDPQINGVV